MESAATQLLTSEQIRWKIRRMAWEIAESATAASEILLVGIVPRGDVLASRLASELNSIGSKPVRVGRLTIDKEQPVGSSIALDFMLSDSSKSLIVVVDDVLNTGKTLLHALKPFLEVELHKLLTAVLVDRDHKAYPVRADVAGLVLSTTVREHVKVELGGQDAVWLS